MDAPCFSSRFCLKTSHCHHLLAFFPSCILVPGSPGKSCTCTLSRVHENIIRPSRLLPLLHGPVLMLVFSLSLWVVHRVQHRHPVWSAACIHSKLTILTSFYKDQFLAIWATVARLLDWTTREHRQSSLPMCITGHVALSVVQHCSTADRKQFCQSSSNHNLSFVKLV